MLTAGIDIGSTAAKAVIMEEKEIKSYAIIPTGSDSVKTAQTVMEQALNRADVRQENVQYIVATGYGRIVVPFADKNITEISCHAKGAVFTCPDARTILDIGGQDCKVVCCDERGRIQNFVLNDKCAAGTGRFLEMIAKTLDIAIEEMGELSFQTDGEIPVISSICVLFARSEIMRLMRRGYPRNEILAGLLEAQTDRIVSLLRKTACLPELIITGGVAKNSGMVKRLEQKSGMTALKVQEPQIIGALGAAFFASEALAKQKRGAD
ncbi:MAG: acyl-CoA dehydratase activase [Lachnospiraceae bacterium]|nr:acyl-CoA dehydratase activase [Lachnospiraceae bacterium]